MLAYSHPAQIAQSPAALQAPGQLAGQQLLAELLSRPLPATSTAKLLDLEDTPLRAGLTLMIPAAQGTAAQQYTVKAGDTLSGIALQLYGSAGLWQQIYSANQAVIGANPGLIFPGQVLSIPATSGQPTPAQPTLPPQSGQGMGRYTVKAGDTLSTIAQQAYGNAGSWRLIYDANKSVIGANPGMIFAGTELNIPAVGVTPGAGQSGQSGQGMGRYTVKAGDTLSTIAQQAYGNAGLWPQIYNANRDAIGANPGLIRVGVELVIP